MKLIGSLTSPYVRKVRIVLGEKSIDHEFTNDPPFSPDTRVAQVNPLGKVPALIMDDGYILFDSRVIVEYLDDLNGPESGRLIPTAGPQRLRVKRWEALADGIIDACVAIYLERKRPESQQSQEWIERQQKKIDQGLQAVAAELGDKPWCEGESMTLADIALGCAFGYLDARFPAVKWRDTYPNLVRLADKLAERQSFKTTIAPN
ncbi:MULTISPECIES: glutathione S-transferase [Nitrosomonas]|uniref:Putative glutathione S-transferase protein n=1 Tax=Nitrosomonas europaea (strain ATCC 19718 / CIP 103999 / KCTC 2705 / NBRC 14298) TaxID=228410 RepID=Q82TE5_NITEU|nr:MULTISPECIES: glutathione S-transferase [Nitrosomonas]CAD85863.1 putative glutathione S-transferase protein [Nitrosomonas europaea ATCC 19718]SDW43102.1 glutathione S-transferase [Nitrosomonas europaea]SET00102.1 glutathione S-transferase [Nitrosomonas europaea]SJZ50815.1 glutathione S-transferase [Nitrosomonas europaea]HBF25641.1 glutathione S-transferase [Nitrosomonas sp.]